MLADCQRLDSDSTTERAQPPHLAYLATVFWRPAGSALNLDVDDLQPTACGVVLATRPRPPANWVTEPCIDAATPDDGTQPVMIDANG